VLIAAPIRASSVSYPEAVPRDPVAMTLVR